MSHIGRLPVQIPAGVSVEETETMVVVTGPKGTLSQAKLPSIAIETAPERVVIRPADNHRFTRAKHGLFRQLVANMITGVTTGFTRQLEMKGTGYRAQVEGNELVLTVGYSHPVRLTAPDGITFKVEKNVLISVEGIDRQLVGQVAANVRAVRKPEPYKGKGIRYSGERVRLKPGKAAKAAAAK